MVRHVHASMLHLHVPDERIWPDYAWQYSVQHHVGVYYNGAYHWLNWPGRNLEYVLGVGEWDEGERREQ